MKHATRLAVLLAACLIVTACTLRPPPKTSAHQDAPRSGAFWERNEQRD